jgi:hypothetical protein
MTSDHNFPTAQPLTRSTTPSQIVKAFRERSTGQLALFTFFLNTVGCCVRIFTTLQVI